MREITCDLCGKKLKDADLKEYSGIVQAKNTIAIEFSGIDTEHKWFGGNKSEKELCKECYIEFGTYIKEFVNRKQKEQTAKEDLK